MDHSPLGLVLPSCFCYSNPTGHSDIHSNISWAPSVGKANPDSPKGTYESKKPTSVPQRWCDQTLAT